MVQRGGVRGHVRKEGQAFAAAHDRKAVVAHGSADQHHIAGPGIVSRGRGRGKHLPDACGIDENFVASTARHHFGIARHNAHTRFAGCRAHVGHNALEGFEGQAFFKDKSAAQVAGPRAQHGNVVDGAMHSQAADAAACEKQGRHRVGIGAHGQRAGDIGQKRCIVHAFQQGIGKMAHETLCNKALRGSAAAASIKKKAIVHYRSEYLK